MTLRMMPPVTPEEFGFVQISAFYTSYDHTVVYASASALVVWVFTKSIDKLSMAWVQWPGNGL
jgi:hypothetical protein